MDLAVLNEADLVLEAMCIATHVEVGYAQVLRWPVGWADRWTHDLPPLTAIATVRRYPYSFDEGWEATPTLIDRESIIRVPGLVASLRSAPANIRIASRRLSTAELRGSPDDRTIDACIGLEALLGEGRDELSHRLALRAATALATRSASPANASSVYQLVKKVYSHRSAVVHGTDANKTRRVSWQDNTYPTSTIAVILLRELLIDVLARTEGWTAKSLDDALLGALSPSEGTGGEGAALAD